MIDFPPVTAGEPVVVSATTFVAYLRCPESAAARLRGQYGPDSRAAFTGGLAHRVFGRHLTSGAIADADFPQACREEIGSAMNAKVGSLGLKPSDVRNIISEVRDLYERFKRFPVDGFEVAEAYVEVEPAPGVVLRGSIDAVFGEQTGIRLVDWKTGQLGQAQEQLAFYGLLWTLDRGEIPGHLEAVSVKTGESYREVPSRASCVMTAQRVADLVNDVRSTWSSGEDASRVAGPWCRYCPVLDSCNEGAAAMRTLQ